MTLLVYPSCRVTRLLGECITRRRRAVEMTETETESRGGLSRQA